MKNGFLRNLKLDIHIFFTGMKAIIPMLVIIYFVYPFMGITVKAEYLALAFIFIPLLLLMQRSTVYYKNAVGFSITRKNYYLSGNAIKIIYAVVAVAVCFVCGFFTDEIPFHNLNILLMIFLSALFMGYLGDISSLMMYKFDRIGVVLYFIVSMLFTFGIVAVVIFVMMKKIPFDIILLSVSSPLINAIILILSIALGVLNWHWVKKMPVKA